MLGNATTSREQRRKLRQVANAKAFGSRIEATDGTENPKLPLESGAPRKWPITIAVMVGAMMEVLDTSIINVSLPHMQA